MTRYHQYYTNQAGDTTSVLHLGDQGYQVWNHETAEEIATVATKEEGQALAEK